MPALILRAQHPSGTSYVAKSSPSRTRIAIDTNGGVVLLVAQPVAFFGEDACDDSIAVCCASALSAQVKS